MRLLSIVVVSIMVGTCPVQSDPDFSPILEGSRFEYRYERYSWANHPAVPVGTAIIRQGVLALRFDKVERSGDTLRFGVVLQDSMSEGVVNSTRKEFMYLHDSIFEGRGSPNIEYSFSDFATTPLSWRGYPIFAVVSSYTRTAINPNLLRMTHKDLETADTTFFLKRVGSVYSRYYGFNAFGGHSAKYQLVTHNGQAFNLSDHMSEFDPVAISTWPSRHLKKRLATLAEASIYDLRGRLLYFSARPSAGWPSNRARYSP